MKRDDQSATSVSSGPTRAWSAILWIGLVAGTLDITDSLIFNWLRGITPTMIFQYIASGLIGPRSFTLGGASVALGVALHYLIALAWTGAFYLTSRRIPVMRRRPVLCGLLYGGFVYLVMNFVVLPLSRVPLPRSTPTAASRINGILAVVLLIGLTISLLVRFVDSRCASAPRAGSRQAPAF